MNADMLIHIEVTPPVGVPIADVTALARSRVDPATVTEVDGKVHIDLFFPNYAIS